MFGRDRSWRAFPLIFRSTCALFKSYQGEKGFGRVRIKIISRSCVPLTEGMDSKTRVRKSKAVGSMIYRFELTRRAVGPLAAAVLLLGTAGCAGGRNVVSSAFTATGFGPNVSTAQGFVEESRATDMRYISVEGQRPPRKPAKTTEQVQATERSMDAARSRNEALGRAATQEGQQVPDN